MRLIVSLLLVALLVGCIPIGIRGGTMPDRSSADDPIVAQGAAVNGS